MRYLESERRVAQWLEKNTVGRAVSEKFARFRNAKAVRGAGKVASSAAWVAVPAITAYEYYHVDQRADAVGDVDAGDQRGGPEKRPAPTPLREQERRDPRRRVRDRPRRGEVLPITRILTIARARLPGEIVEVELESDERMLAGDSSTLAEETYHAAMDEAESLLDQGVIDDDQTDVHKGLARAKV